MKQALFIFLLFLFPAKSLGVSEPLFVVTTTADLMAITKAVGGDRVKAESIAKGFQDPHYVEAKPSFMRLLNRARLLFSNGLQLETGWLPLLVQGARNPNLIQVDLSQGISILERPIGPISRAQGDIHPEGNPHYWLDPRNGALMARRIAQVLKALPEANGEDFEQNLNFFESDLGRRRQKWEEKMDRFRGTEVVAYHKQWEYLAKWLGLSIIGYVEDKPGIPPAPRHLASLIQTMQQRKVKALLVANFTNPSIPRSVAHKAEAKMVMLPASVGGEKGIETYSDLFDSIIGKLSEALQ
jgi:zinc/manganese transport system substrate-binding protein